MNNTLLGKLGESYARNCLIRQKFRIIARNYRYGRYSEIDIIAQRAKAIYFIEVKTRIEFSLKEHYKSIGHFKINKIRRGISKFLSENRQFHNSELKIMALMVLINPYTRIPRFVFYDYLD